MMSGFAFSILHVSAQMQGAESAETVVEAIERLQREALNVICVIRGGGSPVDLAWLDDDRIARTVANSLLPIWVGIGHEIDVGETYSGGNTTRHSLRPAFSPVRLPQALLLTESAWRLHSSLVFRSRDAERRFLAADCVPSEGTQSLQK